LKTIPKNLGINVGIVCGPITQHKISLSIPKFLGIRWTKS